MRRVLAMVVCALVVQGVVPAAAQGPPKRLWLVDDGATPPPGSPFPDTMRTLLLVQEDGRILGPCSDSTGNPVGCLILNNGLGRGADSSITVDPADGTLWGIKEANPARLVHYTPSGVIEEILLFDNGTSSTSNCTFTNGTRVPWRCFALGAPILFPEGAAIDFADDAVWIVEDPPSGAADPNSYLYKLRRSDFAQLAKLNLTELGIVSPQEVAVDPFDGSLWMTDNDNLGPSANPRICNVRVDRTTNTAQPPFCFRVRGLDPSAPNALDSTQGITVDEIDGSLWVTSRFTQKVYHLSTDGMLLGTTPDPGFPGSLTGVAFAPFIDLGEAGTFSLLGLEGVKLSMSNSKSGIFGHVGLGPGGKQNFSDGFITGNLIVDPTADNSKSNNVVIGGGVIARGLSRAADDARAMAAAAGALAPTQIFEKLKGTNTIHADARGASVVWVNQIEVKDNQTLTLRGGPGALFVINLVEKMKMSGGAIRLEGGVRANRVLFHVVSTGTDLALSGGGQAVGTFLAPGRKVAMSGGSKIEGALIVGGDTALSGGSQVGPVP